MIRIFLQVRSSELSSLPNWKKGENYIHEEGAFKIGRQINFMINSIYAKKLPTGCKKITK